MIHIIISCINQIEDIKKMKQQISQQYINVQYWCWLFEMFVLFHGFS